MSHHHHRSGARGAAKRGLGPHDVNWMAMGLAMKFHKNETGVVNAGILAVTRSATTRGR